MLPKFLDLINIIQNEDKCFNFLQEYDIFYFIERCDICGSNVVLKKSYRCTRRYCRKRVSLYTGTIFSKSELKCMKDGIKRLYWRLYRDMLHLDSLFILTFGGDTQTWVNSSMFNIAPWIIRNNSLTLKKEHTEIQLKVYGME
jgi:hypothetical protein